MTMDTTDIPLRISGESLSTAVVVRSSSPITSGPKSKKKKGWRRRKEKKSQESNLASRCKNLRKLLFKRKKVKGNKRGSASLITTAALTNGRNDTDSDAKSNFKRTGSSSTASDLNEAASSVDDPMLDYKDHLKAQSSCQPGTGTSDGASGEDDKEIKQGFSPIITKPLPTRTMPPPPPLCSSPSTPSPLLSSSLSDSSGPSGTESGLVQSNIPTAANVVPSKAAGAEFGGIRSNLDVGSSRRTLPLSVSQGGSRQSIVSDLTSLCASRQNGEVGVSGTEEKHEHGKENMDVFTQDSVVGEEKKDDEDVKHENQDKKDKSAKLPEGWATLPKGCKRPSSTEESTKPTASRARHSGDSYASLRTSTPRAAPNILYLPGVSVDDLLSSPKASPRVVSNGSVAGSDPLHQTPSKDDVEAMSSTLTRHATPSQSQALYLEGKKLRRRRRYVEALRCHRRALDLMKERKGGSDATSVSPEISDIKEARIEYEIAKIKLVFAQHRRWEESTLLTKSTKNATSKVATTTACVSSTNEGKKSCVQDGGLHHARNILHKAAAKFLEAELLWLKGDGCKCDKDKDKSGLAPDERRRETTIKVLLDLAALYDEKLGQFEDSVRCYEEVLDLDSNTVTALESDDIDDGGSSGGSSSHFLRQDGESSGSTAVRSVEQVGSNNTIIVDQGANEKEEQESRRRINRKRRRKRHLERMRDTQRKMRRVQYKQEVSSSRRSRSNGLCVN